MYPIGQPPVYTPPYNLLPLPIYECFTKQCEWKQTALILDGPNYDFKAFGMSTFPGGLRMSKPHPVNRAYLVEPQGTKHQPILLKNRVLAFDVDVSGLQCGYNAAVYYSMMPFQSIGTGYCDAQGTNPKDSCNEYDIFEANAAAVVQASHSCEFKPGSWEVGNCDNWGCSINSRRTGGPKPFGYIDSTKPYRVVTKFITDDGTDKGTLVAVEQKYLQQGKEFKSPTVNDDFCFGLGAGNPEYGTTGKLQGMGKAFDYGMTFIFSLWGFGNDTMSWLDGGINQPDCKFAANANNAVTFSNIVLASLDQPLAQ
jgi:cellulase